MYKFFIHASVCRYFTYFHILDIVNMFAMNCIEILILISVLISVLSHKFPDVGQSFCTWIFPTVCWRHYPLPFDILGTSIKVQLMLCTLIHFWAIFFHISAWLLYANSITVLITISSVTFWHMPVRWLQFYFFTQDLFGNLWPFVIPYKDLNCVFYFYKNFQKDFGGDYIEFIH